MPTMQGEHQPDAIIERHASEQYTGFGVAQQAGDPGDDRGDQDRQQAHRQKRNVKGADGHQCLPEWLGEQTDHETGNHSAENGLGVE